MVAPVVTFDLLSLIENPGPAPDAMATKGPPVPTGPRRAVSCKRCGTWLYHSTTADTSRSACPICDGPLEYRGEVRPDNTVTRTVEDMACNDQCQGAKGVVCNCHCGGTNHGCWFTVTVTLVESKVSLALEDTSKVDKLRARNLPLIEQAEHLAGELVDMLEHRYARVIADRRAGRWLDAGDYAAVCAWSDYRKAIRKAQTFKQPAARVKKLEQLRAEIIPDAGPGTGRLL